MLVSRQLQRAFASAARRPVRRGVAPAPSNLGPTRVTRQPQELRRRELEVQGDVAEAKPSPAADFAVEPQGGQPSRRRRKKGPHKHGTDLQDLGSPDADGAVLPVDSATLGRVRRLLRRPVAPLPRTAEVLVKYGAPMSAEDLTFDAPSVFVESRQIIDEVLERRQALQASPDYVAPDTPFWRVPPKMRKKPKVQWQEEDPERDGEGGGVPGGGTALAEVGQAATASEAADRLKGIVNLASPGKRWQAAMVSPARGASRVLATPPDDAEEKPAGDPASEDGQPASTAAPKAPIASAGRAQHDRRSATSKRRDAGSHLIASLRERAVEFATTGVHPDIQESLEQALQHHPGTERAARLREMRACTKDFQDLVSEGTASVENFNELIRAYGMQRRMSDALKLHDTMQAHGFTPDEETYVSLIVGASVQRDAELARQLFLQLRSRLLPATPRIYATMIKAHVRAGDLASGFSLLRKMEDERLKPDVVVHTVLIDGLVKEGKLEKAWEQFHSIRTWKLISPDEVLFTVMIKACAKAKEAERAMNILDDLRMTGLYPTDLTYGELMHAVASTPSHAHKAWDFFRQMQAEDMPVSPFVFGQLLVACRTLGDAKRAREVVRDMHQHGIALRPAMYCDIVGLFATAMHRPKTTEGERLQNLQCAWHVVAEARRHYGAGGLDWARLLNEVMAVYIAGRMPHFAVEMLRQYAVFGVEPDATTYRQLCEMLGHELKDVGRFFALWEVLPRNPQPPDDLYQLALEMALESRSARRTCAVLEEFHVARVFPSPQLTDRLAKAGRHVVQIHHMVGKLVALNRDLKADRARRETALLQTHMDERDLELAVEGKTWKSPTPEQEERARFFDKMKKKGLFTRPWYPKAEYKQLRKKGGPAYARKHDKPRPNLLAA